MRQELSPGQPAAMTSERRDDMLAHATPQDDPQAGSPTKEKIQQLQEAMLEARCDMPEAVHHFLPGVYCREFTMPAGMLVVGKIHKHAHPMMVIKGRAQIITEFDNTLVEAGFCAVSPPGAKRVVYAFEETTFITFHHNPEDVQDLEVIETRHIEDEDFQLEYHKAIQEVLL